MVTQPQSRLWIASQTRSIVIECLYRASWVFIDLNRYVIELSHSLDLKVVAPTFVFSVRSDVRLDIGVPVFVDEGAEVLWLQVNVIHALMPH